MLHGGSIRPGSTLTVDQNQFNTYNDKFWDWFQRNSLSLDRFHILGGEPFLQKDLQRLIDFFDSVPHPNLEFNIITNLSLKAKLIVPQLEKLAEIKQQGNLKRIDLLTSIDSWHPSQQYVRYGLELDQFEQNMQHILRKDSYRIGLLSTISSLTICGLPLLAQKYLEWNQVQTIFWYMHLVLPSETSIFSPTIFDYEVFADSINETRTLLPDESWDDKKTIEVFDGIVSKLKNNCVNDPERQAQLLQFLKANDKRRNTSWQENFPWLATVFENNNVV
jgi:hypothetical protein